MAEQKKLVTVDDELYYPAEEFERNIELVIRMVRGANVASIVSLFLSISALILSVLL